MDEGVWKEFLFNEVFSARLSVLIIEFLVLIWIARKIRIADRAINLSAYGVVEVDENKQLVEVEEPKNKGSNTKK